MSVPRESVPAAPARRAEGDEVVLVDDAGSVLGSHDRTTVHGRQTPLHLGFSCYLFDTAGRVLVTRRALSKRTFPGVWTNSFCGHPRPGEELVTAVRRHARHELGVAIEQVETILADFRYQATDDAGTMENELCPVLRATTASNLDPRADEVCDWSWVQPRSLADAARSAPWALSPWSLLQVPLLRDAGVLGDLT